MPKRTTQPSLLGETEKPKDTRTILERWGLTIEDLTQLVDENPSLKGVMIGYIGEFQLRKVLCSDPRITSFNKPDDHNREEKNDLTIEYRGHSFRIEVKSLQSTLIKKIGNVYYGTFQCDASDRRAVTLPNGDRIETTCLLVGGFDIVAINLFTFGEGWHFAFALNRDLPKSSFRKYTPEQQQYLIASSIKITWPPETWVSGTPFTTDPFILFDKLVEEREALAKLL